MEVKLGILPTCGRAGSSFMGVGNAEGIWEKDGMLLRKDRHHQKVWGQCP